MMTENMMEPLFGGKYDYDNLRDLDVITKAKPLLDSGQFYIRPDGRIAPNHTDRMGYDVPWIYVRPSAERRCWLWHKVYFPLYKIVYSECQNNCWKVVVRPKTIIDLFKLYEYQVYHTERYCKCGIEQRDTVNGLYGGYFYNDSKESGEECRDAIRRDMDKILSPGTPVYLKRACTEFEAEWGDSREWEISEDQKELEKTLDATFVQDVLNLTPTKHARAFVMLKWLHWACSHGDETYLHFTGGVPLTPKIIKYE